MLHIQALERLVQELARLPGIGPKSAQRLAYFIVKSPRDYSVHLAEALARVREEVHDCPQCFNLTDADLCRFCADPGRSDDLLCVVEEPSDILRIEGSGAFRGRYHVLRGVISPLDGVGPEDLKINELVGRINQGLVREVIMALDADLEGDTTVLYLSKILCEKGIRLSRIAHGVPIGSDIEYIDDRTMGRALENRVEI
ncbi:MAG: recombination protein RecR [Bdellovibrio sp.]|nr:MAG: recombination protein RecR [Bdellovibrio sp.]